MELRNVACFWRWNSETQSGKRRVESWACCCNSKVQRSDLTFADKPGNWHDTVLDMQVTKNTDSIPCRITSFIPLKCKDWNRGSQLDAREQLQKAPKKTHTCFLNKHRTEAGRTSKFMSRNSNSNTSKWSHRRTQIRAKSISRNKKLELEIKKITMPTKKEISPVSIRSTKRAEILPTATQKCQLSTKKRLLPLESPIPITFYLFLNVFLPNSRGREWRIGLKTKNCPLWGDSTIDLKNHIMVGKCTLQ